MRFSLMPLCLSLLSFCGECVRVLIFVCVGESLESHIQVFIQFWIVLPFTLFSFSRILWLQLQISLINVSLLKICCDQITQNILLQFLRIPKVNSAAFLLQQSQQSWRDCFQRMWKAWKCMCMNPETYTTVAF